MIYLLFLFIIFVNNNDSSYCFEVDKATLIEPINNETHTFVRMFNRYIKCKELQRYNLSRGYEQAVCDNVCKGLFDETYHGECISEYCVCIRDKLSNFIFDDMEISTQNSLTKTEEPLYRFTKKLL